MNYFVGHVVHIINRFPTSLLNNASPYENLFGIISDISNLKSFGCLAFATTLNNNRIKFQNRVDQCVFLGYESGMKGYKLYIIIDHKFLVSRIMQFYENVYPYTGVNDIDGNSTVVINKNDTDDIITKKTNDDKLSNRPIRKHNQPSYLNN